MGKRLRLCLIGLAAGLGLGAAAPVGVGIDVAGMDRGVPAGQDFDRHANGGWESRTAIPPDRLSTGTIDALEERSRTQVRAILEELARDSASRAGKAYRAFLDEAAIERAGMAPVTARLTALRRIDSHAAWLAATGEARRSGTDLPLAFVVEPDDADPDRYALTVAQAGLGLPDRDYYLSEAPAMQAARQAYRTYLVATLGLADGADADADARADRILRFETRIAAVSWPSAASRDAQRTYNPMPATALDAGLAHVRLSSLLAGLGYRTDRVVVRQPDAVAAILRLVDAESVETLRDLLVVRTLHRFAEVLPRAVREADFAFYGRAVGGIDAPEPRWRRGVAFVLATMPDEVSRVYVARHFPPETRTAAEAMVRQLVAAFGQRIEALDWMAPATKQRALRKLAAFRVQIGYPDRWHDYAGLQTRAGDAFGNARRAFAFAQDWERAKVGRPVYRWEWPATPMTVDAFANYPKVTITFPAAILQPPFFDPQADPASNFGGIGASIAHEMTHHFDDQGARYDETGRLASWWAPADRAAFARRADVLVAQFAAYEPLPDQHVDGRLTLGENIADLGGLAIAHDAWRASLQGIDAPVIAGLTGDQRFFLGWAQIWRLKYREADLRRRLLTNPHAPAAQRVWTVRNLAPWVRAFSVRESDYLFLPPEKRAAIW